MKERVVFILGLKWFDKVNGNTYCRPVVFTDRGNALSEGYRYGYGNQYLEYAKYVCEINGVEYEKDSIGSVPHTDKWVSKKELKDYRYY